MYTLSVLQVRNFLILKLNCKYQNRDTSIHQYFHNLQSRNKDVQSESWIRLQNEEVYGFARQTNPDGTTLDHRRTRIDSTCLLWQLCQYRIFHWAPLRHLFYFHLDNRLVLVWTDGKPETGHLDGNCSERTSVIIINAERSWLLVWQFGGIFTAGMDIKKST